MMHPHDATIGLLSPNGQLQAFERLSRLGTHCTSFHRCCGHKLPKKSTGVQGTRMKLLGN